MKKSIVAVIALVAILAACGPDRAKLRTELQSINAELDQIRTSAAQQQARMSAAEFDAHIGSFAAGYGAVSGDYDLAGRGVDVAAQSAMDFGTSSNALEQLKNRHDQLAKRRAKIVSKLD